MLDEFPYIVISLGTDARAFIRACFIVFASGKLTWRRRAECASPSQRGKELATDENSPVEKFVYSGIYTAVREEASFSGDVESRCVHCLGKFR